MLNISYSDFESSGDLVFDPTTDKFFATSSNFSSDTLYSISRSGEAIEVRDIGFYDVLGLSLENEDLISDHLLDARSRLNRTEELAQNTKLGKLLSAY